MDERPGITETWGELVKFFGTAIVGAAFFGYGVLRLIGWLA